mmetsp:Transcript_41834/g.75351  ORF Transcript_41834/g.75351 Transcript_41834/m.75351 type:complete len:287 (-) Transcript_41834:445-1305(-)
MHSHKRSFTKKSCCSSNLTRLPLLVRHPRWQIRHFPHTRVLNVSLRCCYRCRGRRCSCRWRRIWRSDGWRPRSVMLARRFLAVVGGILPKDNVVGIVGRLLFRRGGCGGRGGDRCGSRCRRGGCGPPLPRSRRLCGVVRGPLRRIIRLPSSSSCLLTIRCLLLLLSIRRLLLLPVITLLSRLLLSIRPLLPRLRLLSILIIIRKRHARHDALGRLFRHDGLDHLFHLLGSCRGAADANYAVEGSRRGSGRDLNPAARGGLHLLDDAAAAADDHADVFVGTLRWKSK